MAPSLAASSLCFHRGYPWLPMCKIPSLLASRLSLGSAASRSLSLLLSNTSQMPLCCCKRGKGGYLQSAGGALLVRVIVAPLVLINGGSSQVALSCTVMERSCGKGNPSTVFPPSRESSECVWALDGSVSTEELQES